MLVQQEVRAARIAIDGSPSSGVAELAVPLAAEADEKWTAVVERENKSSSSGWQRILLLNESRSGCNIIHSRPYTQNFSQSHVGAHRSKSFYDLRLQLYGPLRTLF